MRSSTIASFALSALGAAAAKPRADMHWSLAHEKAKWFVKRQADVVYPANITDWKTIYAPSGTSIRYKEPGKSGVCETTPGVNSYSGYIDLGYQQHAFFWFFESRSNPAEDPVTIWLNGGPGSDSQIGLFQELGPCSITENLTSVLNPYSWSNASNMIFLSQPYGVGFSYEEEAIGSMDPVSGAFVPAEDAPPTGRYPTINATAIDTTQLAAVAGWEILQAFYANLPALAPNVKSKVFNLWTESYGGHYGPAFFKYFQEQNNLIDGENPVPGQTKLIMNTLGIGNGIVNEYIQAEYYPEFAVNNTYGIKAYNDTVYSYAKFAYYMANGCRDQIDLCQAANQSTLSGQAICTEAADMCRDNVESPYYYYSGRGVYDIRDPYNDPTPPSYFIDYLNTAAVQEAIGVNLNYTDSNLDIYWAFQETGDFVYNSLLTDLEAILESGVSVTLYNGDADYIVNWFGSQALSLAVNYTHADQFRAAGYAPLMYEGKEYGEVRQSGNFSFVRIYEAGHEVPFYQPEAAYAMFSRAINLMNIADGTVKVTPEYNTTGDAQATHTESFVPLTASTPAVDIPPGTAGFPSATPEPSATEPAGGYRKAIIW